MKAKLNGNPRSTSPKLNPVQRAVSNGKRELDHREYDRGYEASGEKVLRNQIPKEAKRPSEGLSDPMEAAVNKACIKNFPKEPPPALFEATDLIDAATAFWGLEEGDITGPSRKVEVCWPRYVCASLLRAKGMTLCSIGKVFNRDHGTIINALKQFTALTEIYPAYNQQAKEFDKFCWSIIGQAPLKRYKLGSRNR